MIAGDVLRPGDVSDYSLVIAMIRERVQCSALAVFGNTEFQEDRPAIRSQNPSVVFLDDEAATLDIQGRHTLVVGSTGSLERPTSWQKRNIPHISDVYKARVETIAKLLEQAAEVKILLTHYASTYNTLEGETRSSFPWLGTRRLEPIIVQRKTSVVVHAHAHGGKATASLDGVPVHNVSLPLNERIVTFEL